MAKKCNGDCFNCEYDDCILEYDDVPLDEELDEFILDKETYEERKRSREFYKNNKEWFREYHRNYYLKHKDKFKAYKHAYYIKNKEWISKKNSIYKKRKYQEIKKQREKLKQEFLLKMTSRPPPETIEDKFRKRLSKVLKAVEKIMEINIAI